MWAPTGLDGENTRSRERFVLDQELLVFACEDIVRDGS